MTFSSLSPHLLQRLSSTKGGHGVWFLSSTNLSTAADLSFVVTDVPSDQIGTSGGYAHQSLASVVWTVGASAKQYKFDAADLVWTATGGPLTNVKYLALGVSGGKALCWSKLSTSQFTVTIGNTLTIQFAAAGIFTLT